MRIFAVRRGGEREGYFSISAGMEVLMQRTLMDKLIEWKDNPRPLSRAVSRQIQPRKIRPDVFGLRQAAHFTAVRFLEFETMAWRQLETYANSYKQGKETDCPALLFCIFSVSAH